MDAFLAKLGQQLAELERSCHPTGFAVAFSGGLDSSVLLAACRHLDLTLPLRALHIDHGLHPQSAAWAEDCTATARALGVEFATARITVQPGIAQSLEAVAREQRYRALGDLLHAGEMLLTAHHEDDQLETVMLRLLRGAGVKGLRGILTSGPLAGGYLGRPLLAFSKAEIVAAATTWQLGWLEDPSNREQRFDRNYLRTTVLPLIKARWPAAARTVTRSARQMAEAEALLERLAVEDAAGGASPERVPLSLLRGLDGPRQRNVLRHLLSVGGLPLPSATQADELLTAVAVTRRDAQTQVQWPGAQARVYGDYLYLMTAMSSGPAVQTSGSLKPGEPWIGPEGRLELIGVPADSSRGMLPDAWVHEGLSVQFRAGGERIKPLGSTHHRTLKKLLQDARIVPWMRSRIPLVYRAGQLVAVADLWVCDATAAELSPGRGWQLRWTGHPSLY